MIECLALIRRRKAFLNTNFDSQPCRESYQHLPQSRLREWSLSLDCGTIGQNCRICSNSMGFTFDCQHKVRMSKLYKAHTGQTESEQEEWA